MKEQLLELIQTGIKANIQLALELSKSQNISIADILAFYMELSTELMCEIPTSNPIDFLVEVLNMEKPEITGHNHSIITKLHLISTWTTLRITQRLDKSLVLPPSVRDLNLTDINNCNLTNINLSNITHLSLSNCYSSIEPTAILNAPNLVHLHSYKSTIYNFCNIISALAKLKYLSYTSGNTVDTIPAFNALCDLEVLFICGLAVTKMPNLNNCTKLTLLSLDQSAIGDKFDIQSISACSSLRDVYLPYNFTNKHLVPKFEKILPSCKFTLYQY